MLSFSDKTSRKSLKTPYLCFLLFCPHQTSWSLRKTPRGSGRGRWGPSTGRRALGCLQHLRSQRQQRTFAWRGETGMFSQSQERKGLFRKEEGLSPHRDLPGAACCLWLEGHQQYLGTVSPLSWWGDERAGAAAALTALSLTLTCLIHRSAGVCINILRSGRIDDWFRNFAPGVVK